MQTPRAEAGEKPTALGPTWLVCRKNRRPGKLALRVSEGSFRPQPQGAESENRSEARALTVSWHRLGPPCAYCLLISLGLAPSPALSSPPGTGCRGQGCFVGEAYFIRSTGLLSLNCHTYSSGG